MAKTTNASDKFIVRLPDGMRDRMLRINLSSAFLMECVIVSKPMLKSMAVL